ncbi:cellulose-binding domain-containing protein [Kitasatospora sp. DSM 101779]|nr:cellulose-binding domain-containing protein [Kitasatospora sp. DSM 101779]
MWAPVDISDLAAARAAQAAESAAARGRADGTGVKVEDVLVPGAPYSPASGAVTARNASYDAAIAPGGSVSVGSVSVGYQATHTGITAAPAGFALNGTPCSLG